MHQAIVFDFLFRTCISPFLRTPRGIDRADLGFARYLFGEWPGDCFALVATPRGLRLCGRTQALRCIARIEDLWHEAGDSDDDPTFHYALRRLSGDIVGKGEPRNASRPYLRSVAERLSIVASAIFERGSSVATAAPVDSLLLSISQFSLSTTLMRSLLHKRPDLQAIFMLHDVIPIEYPHLVSAGSRMNHNKVLNVAARHASGLLFCSQAARNSVMPELARRGGRPVPTMVIAPPTPAVYLEQEVYDPILTKHPYFLICGAIENRKNHLLLLQAWSVLFLQLKEHAPFLVVAGIPDTGSADILHKMSRAGPVTDRIIIATGLSSPALRRLMANARGLLMPSITEGFGLPIVEALTLGTPVLASDIPAHREAGGLYAIYRSSSDPQAWAKEIGRLTNDDVYWSTLRARIASYRPVTASTYFAQVGEFLGGFRADPERS